MGTAIRKRVATTFATVGPRPVLLGHYALHRGARAAGDLALRRLYSRAVARASDDLRPWQPCTVRLPHVSALPAALQSAASRIRAEAEAAFDHRFDVLGSGPTDLGSDIDWHMDFKSGFRWPLVFYQDVPVTRLDDASDAKVPWELSRGHHLLALARAAVLFSESRFSDECWRQLLHWIAHNPAGFGINWTNTMEVGIRATNWVWTLATLPPRSADERSRREVARALHVHARHITMNLEGSPYLRSNHYLGDVLGLLAVGCLFRTSRAGRRWLRRAHRAFEREMIAQVHPDGVNFEASTAYHGLVLEMFILASRLCREANVPLSSAYHARLRRMLEFSYSLRAADGEIPLFGDNDSGRILPADSDRRPTHDHLLALGSSALDAAPFLPGDPSPELAWTFGIDAWKRLASVAPNRTANRVCFPEGGYYVLPSSSLKAVVRCGGVGQNGNGGHAHNDALSLTVSGSGPLIVDSGTSTYTANPIQRNHDRATAAHNTLMVNGAEINPLPADALFRLPGRARIVVESFRSDGSELSLRASHDGYTRLPQRAVHTRTVTTHVDDDRIAISDEVQGVGQAEVTSALHFDPAVSVRWSDDGTMIARRDDVIMQLRFSGPLIRLELVPTMVAKRFGVQEATAKVVATVAGELPVEMGWEIALLPSTSRV